MNYWLDLFTGTTWDEFRKAGGSVTGFRSRLHNTANKIKTGDILLCYLTGVMHWVGALEIVGPSKNNEQIWSVDDFPVRFDVKPLILLDPEFGVPMEQMEGKVDFFCGPNDRGKFKGFVRISLNLFKNQDDGTFVFELLKQAKTNPTQRPVDPKKLARKYNPLYKVEQKRGKTIIETLVSIPEPEEFEPIQVVTDNLEDEKIYTTRHTEIQFNLLSLGADLGLNVWVARNDRTRKWKGQTLGTMPKMVQDLPTQFNEATNRTIELIDILWLKGNSIVAAFEVECTTSIYSGLLRMSDLLALQPNLDIDLYLVAPDERRNKVEQELLRPTFKIREKPLFKVCGFLAFTKLMEKVEGIKRLNLAESLRPDFLQKTAEFFDEE